MLQYQQLLVKAAEGLGWDVQCWHPTVRCGDKYNTLRGPGKIAGYCDKYVLSPLDFRHQWAKLAASPQRPDCVHIVDHSNAPYARHFHGVPVLLTCHDLIAVRRARGEFLGSTRGPRITARWQQQWILNALKTVAWPGFVSQASKNDFIRLTGRQEPTSGWPVLYPAPAQRLEPISARAAATRLANDGIKIPHPFIHHHGGAMWYKNRETVINVFIKCRTRLPNLSLVVSGANLSHQQKMLLQQNDAMEAVVDCGSVTTETLEALYSSASVFLFPSWCEGFGWPPVEAQTCGCPVVASNAGSLEEILQDSAALFQADDIQGMSEAVVALINSPDQLQQLVTKGFVNASRFNFEHMQADYKKWCTSVCGATPSTAR